MSKDIELTPAPTDSVSHLSWSPVADFISVSCWDNTTKIYQVLGNGSSQGKAQIQHDQPALCSAWSKVFKFILKRKRMVLKLCRLALIKQEDF